jgi:Sulfotransferase domain
MVMSNLILPDFLGIGAQKAGTTWLHENLKVHPQAFVPPRWKEVHFFDQPDFSGDWESYSRLFADARGKIKGELTPAYGILPPERIRLVRDRLPRLKLIFLMRNPIDRAWSQALMNLVTQPQRPYEDVAESEFLAHFHSERSRLRGDYETILDNWISEFGRGPIFVGLYEDLVGRPRWLLTEIFGHLGLSTDVDWPAFPMDRTFFKGPDAVLPSPMRRELLKIHREPIKRLGARFGAPAERWLA